MIRDKKALTGVYTVLLMIILIGITLMSSYILNVDKLGSKDKYIGKIQYDTLDVSYDHQFDLLYYDALSGFFAEEALGEIARTGGVDGSCGGYGVYNAWIGKEYNCTPVDFSAGYDLGFLSGILNSYLPVSPKEQEFYFNLKSNDTTITSYMIDEKEYVKDDVTLRERIVFDSYHDYDFGIYSKVYEKSHEVVDECIGYADYEACVNSKFLQLQSMLDIDFQSDCVKDERWVFNEFVANFLDCVESVDNDCGCAFDMDAEKDLLKKDDYRIVVNNKEIRLKLDGRDDLVHIFDDGVDLRFGESPDEAVQAQQIVYEIDYDRNRDVDKITLDMGDGKERVREISLYSNYIDEYQTEKWYSFVRSSAPKEECNVYNRYVDMCVNNKDSEIEDIRFSLYIKDTVPPPPVENVDIEDVEDAEGQVVLTFDKFIEFPMDVAKYHFYIIRNEEDVGVKDISGMDANVTFGAEDIAVLPEVYFDVEDGVRYHFAVVAEDMYGNMLDKAEFYPGMSIDDIAPGNIAIHEGQEITDDSSYRMVVVDEAQSTVVTWNEPTLNVDGTEYKNDTQGYAIVASTVVYDPDEILAEGDLQAVIDSCTASAVCTYVSGRSRQSTEVALSKGENYIAVYPIDEAGNYPLMDSASGAASGYRSYRSNMNTRQSSGIASTKLAEGGWVADRDDKGGETYAGVTTTYFSDWEGWEIVRQTREDLFGSKNAYELTSSEAKRLNQELGDNEELQMLVDQFYYDYQERIGVFRIDSAQVQELAFNFAFNTPEGTMIALNDASGGGVKSTGVTISDALAAQVNSLDFSDDAVVDEFGYDFAASMYEYYSTKQEKFRKGWFNRVEHGVNLYLAQLGSQKTVSIEKDGPNMA